MLQLSDDRTFTIETIGTMTVGGAAECRQEFPLLSFASIEEFIRAYPDALVARIGE